MVRCTVYRANMIGMHVQRDDWVVICTARLSGIMQGVSDTLNDTAVILRSDKTSRVLPAATDTVDRPTDIYRRRYFTTTACIVCYSDQASKWHPISYRFWVIAAYCWNFAHFAFWAPLGKTYDVHRRLIIGKRVMDFLFVLTELFSLGVTAEALREKIDRKSAISPQCGHFDPQF